MNYPAKVQVNFLHGEVENLPLKGLKKKRTDRMKKAERIGTFMFTLMERDQPLEAFTDGLWIDAMDQIIVQSDGTMGFRFLNGSEIAF